MTCFQALHRVNFNPRSREGSDVCRLPGPSRPMHFNPRSREGSDTSALGRWGGFTDFNPRSREGSDPQPYSHYAAIKISIHAPVKGATADPQYYQVII